MSWVRRGLFLGEKILYTELPRQPADRSLVQLLHDQHDAGEALDRGQIQIVHADQRAYDPDWQASVVEEALGDGYPSVRWGGEATTAWSLMPRARHAEIERATDELCRSRPVSVMCQYSPPESLDELARVSNVHGAGLRERLLRASPVNGGLVVAGEIDRSNHDLWRSLLVAATSATEKDDFVVDLSGLEFLDLEGVRSLSTGTARYRELGGRVRLYAPQPHVDSVLRLLGVERVRGLLIQGA